MADKATRTNWKIWRFEQMVTNVNVRIENPSESGMEHYVGLEHLDPDSLRIRRWGSPDDVEATKLCFKKGDIIFGRRRAYQRKLGVAEFDGICSAHAMVVRAKPEVVLPDFLPFFMQSDLFMKRAVEISVGSLSPTINWKTMAVQEFTLPPISQQQEYVAILVKIDDCSNSLEILHERLSQLKLSMISHRINTATKTTKYFIKDLVTFSRGGIWGEDAGNGELNVSVIRSTDIENNGRVNFATAAIRGVRNSEIRERLLVEGDVVIEKSGGGPDQPVGRVVYIKKPVSPSVCSNFMALLRFNSEYCDPQYLFYILWFWHSIGKTKQFQNQTTGIRNLSLVKYLEEIIELPSIDQQQQTIYFLDEIEKAFFEVSSRLQSIKDIKLKILKRICENV